MTLNGEMGTLLSLSGCPLFTIAGRATFACFRGATAREMSEREDRQPTAPQAATSGVRSAAVEAARAGAALTTGSRRRALRPRLAGVTRPGASSGGGFRRGLPAPAEAAQARRRFRRPRPPGSWRGVEASTPPWTVRASVPPHPPRTGLPAVAGGRPGLPRGRGFPPAPKPPPPRGPPGGAPASSPERTWLPAPGLPSPARSPRAGRRRGSCSGPGCSTPPPWGCGRGSCRSRLGRRRRRQAADPARAPPPETRPEAATSELQDSDPCPRPPGGAGPRRGLAGFQPGPRRSLLSSG